MIVQVVLKGSGGNLQVESLQDTATYAEKNQQLGVSGMIGAVCFDETISQMRACECLYAHQMDE